MNGIDEKVADRLRDIRGAGPVDEEALWAGIESELGPVPKGGTGRWQLLTAGLLLIGGLALFMLHDDDEQSIEENTASVSPHIERLDESEPHKPAGVQEREISLGDKSSTSEMTARAEGNQASNKVERNSSIGDAKVSIDKGGVDDVNTFRNKDLTHDKKEEKTAAARDGGLMAKNMDSQAPLEKRASIPTNGMAQVTAKEERELMPSAKANLTYDVSLDPTQDFYAQLLQGRDARIKFRTDSDQDELSFYLDPLGIDENGLQILKPEKRLIGKNKPASQLHDGPSSWPIALDFRAGPNWMFQRFGQGELEESLSNSTSPDRGHGVEVLAYWTLRKNFRLSFGLQYDELQADFDWTQTKNTQIVLDDRLIGHIQNQDGSQSPIFGMDTVNAVSTRKVFHNNQYTMISVPLSIGWYQQKQRWIYGLDMGLAYSRIIEAKGRGLETSDSPYQAEDVRLEDMQKDYISLFFRPHLNYMLNDRWGLSLSPSLQVLSMEDFIGRQLGGSDLNLGLKAGFHFRLNP